MDGMATVDIIAKVLVIIAAINWGLFGLFGLDIIAYLPGIFATIVYVLVGISGLWMAYALYKEKKA